MLKVSTFDCHACSFYFSCFRNQSHFVLLVGTQSAGVFYVNDPYNYTNIYTYEEIHDIIMYSVLSTPQTQNIPKSYPLFKQCNSVCTCEIIMNFSTGLLSLKASVYFLFFFSL